MGWGADERKAIEAAKKAGVNVSSLKSSDSFLDVLDEANKLFDLLWPAYQDVKKFTLEPDPNATRDIKMFFQHRARLTGLRKEVVSKTPKYWEELDRIRKPLIADKSKKAALDSLKEGGKSARFALGVLKDNAIFDDLRKDVLMNLAKRHKEEMDALEKAQEKETKEIESAYILV